MKLLCKTIIILGAFSLLIVANALAFPIQAEDQVVMTADGGVPYTMTENGEDFYHTFCLERSNYFSNGGSYYVTSVGDSAIGGGPGYSPDGDEVSILTKWLYAAFFSGDFSANVTAQRVQNAIWFEEEEFGKNDAGYEEAKDDRNYLRDTFGFNGTGYTGWIVKAVNLSKDGKKDNQSQLVGVEPVPEPATMLLLGTGLIGLAGIGRKKIKK